MHVCSLPYGREKGPSLFLERNIYGVIGSSELHLPYTLLYNFKAPVLHAQTFASQRNGWGNRRELNPGKHLRRRSTQEWEETGGYVIVLYFWRRSSSVFHIHVILNNHHKRVNISENLTSLLATCRWTRMAMTQNKNHESSGNQTHAFCLAVE